jgi:glycosyltransferase involved in cell wall biosynthesis
MKILYVSPYLPARDGIGTYTHMLLVAMREQGHDVRIVVPRASHDSPAEVIGSIAFGARGYALLRDTFGSWKPDVVHVQFAVAAFGTRSFYLTRWLKMVRRDLSGPVLITMHEVSRDIGSLRALGRMIYRSLAYSCDRVIVHTSAARDALSGSIGVAASKIVVIAHPRAELPLAYSSARNVRGHFNLNNKKILLAFGFIHVDKGLNDLVRALAIARQSGRVSFDDLRLVVAGAVRPRRGLFRTFEIRDRLHLRRILHYIRRNSLDEYIVFTGYVPDSDVEAWFRAAECVVLPYRRAEQSGVAGLADSFEVPILASTAGGLAEQFGGLRWTFPPRNPERLAATLTDFLDSTSRLPGPAASGRRLANFASVATMTLDTYQTVSGSSVTGSSVSDSSVSDSSVADSSMSDGSAKGDAALCQLTSPLSSAP